jgi:DNA-binding MarR family transcriptional regulator
LQRVLSHGERTLSSPSPERLRAWRLFFETALALIDVLDNDFEHDAGFPIQWYDVLVHIEDAPDGLRMNDIAGRILYSKSGLTRVVDRMEKAGLVRRVIPENDRRSIFVVQTDKGREAMTRARRQHHDWIAEHFSSPLADTDIKALTRALEKLNAHMGTLRPGRISSS